MTRSRSLTCLFMRNSSCLTSPRDTARALVSPFLFSHAFCTFSNTIILPDTSLCQKQQLEFGGNLPRMYPSTNSNFLQFSRPLSTPMCSNDWPPKISTMQYGSNMWRHVQEMIWCLCEFLEVRIVVFFLIHFYVDLPTGPHFNLETKIDWLQGEPCKPLTLPRCSPPLH